VRPIAPRIDGIEETTCHGTDDAPWKAITFGRTLSEEGTSYSVTRWQPNAEERQAIATGADIYLWIVGGLPPHQVEVR
jgi:hypothetical protein